MRRLNAEETKFKIIEQLIILNDDSVFEQIENILDASIHRPKAAKFTKQDVVKRAQKANLDISNKKVNSQENAEKLSKSW